MCKFSDDSKAKLGNAVVYIAERVSDLSKTKLLKLLYLMEETMVTRYHTPFLALPYEVWQAGPVPKDVFVDLSDGPFLLKDYVEISTVNGGTYITAKVAFNDDEFSVSEIAVMDDVLRRFGQMSAIQLVDETHRKGGLWYTFAKENNLIRAFSLHECNNSDVVIDFSRLLSTEAASQYIDSLNIHQTANLLSA